MNRRNAFLTTVAWASVSLALAGSGCGGTSPQLATPQLAQPAAPLDTRASAVKSADTSVPALDAVATPPGTFFVAPYLQLGDTGTMGKRDRLALLWQTADSKTAPAWTVETRPVGKTAWAKSADNAAVKAHPVGVGKVAAHTVWSAPLGNLEPGQLFDYRVLLAGKPVFAARARARRPAADPYRFVVFGDCGGNTPGQKKVAYQTSLAQPDFVFITGDIVYPHGAASEYQTNFFPIYNAETAKAETGAPLMRSTLFLASPGNHDLEYRNFNNYPDALAYYFYWSLPANGPLAAPGLPNTPRLVGSDGEKKAFAEAAGEAYPRMANYSFDYGNAHWTVLDANPYVDWSNPQLRAWVANDLAGAKKAMWRFVAFHQPPFNSSNKHRTEQQMRVLCDVFERGGVDVVWSGHVHNYQRTYPLRFAAVRGLDGNFRAPDGQVQGEWALDKDFDGATRTHPSGVLYIITGAGGESLYDPQIQDKPGEWQPFTRKYIADTYSLTVADVAGAKLTVRQISADGKELDKFTVTK